MKKMAMSLMQRVELATDRGRCGPAISVKTDASCSSQGTCETDAAAEHQEHAKTTGAIPEQKSEMLGRVQQTS